MSKCSVCFEHFHPRLGPIKVQSYSPWDFQQTSLSSQSLPSLHWGPALLLPRVHALSGSPFLPTLQPRSLSPRQDLSRTGSPLSRSSRIGEIQLRISARRVTRLSWTRHLRPSAVPLLHRPLPPPAARSRPRLPSSAPAPPARRSPDRARPRHPTRCLPQSHGAAGAAEARE